MEDNKLYVFVGYRYLFGDNSVNINAVYQAVELNGAITYVELDQMEEFESNNDVVKLDKEVFEKVRALREYDKGLIEVGLSKSVMAGIRSYHDYLVNEFEFKRPDVKKYILKEYNEGGR